MGADKAVHLIDDALAGSDALATSAALAKVLERIGFDLVILGAESTDARMGVMAAMLAERLGVPQVSLASKVEVDGTATADPPAADYGYDKVESSLPAVISVVEKINEPRYPSFKGIMAAKKKPVDDADAWPTSASTRARSAWPRPPPRWSASRTGRHGRRARSSRTRATAAPRRPSSSPRRSSSEPARRARHDLICGRAACMAEVLVLAEHDGETVKKVTGELLTLARRFGEPAAVWIGAGAEAAPASGWPSSARPRCTSPTALTSTTTWSPRRPRCSPRLVGAEVAGRPCCSPPPARARRSPAGWRSRPAPV